VNAAARQRVIDTRHQRAVVRRVARRNPRTPWVAEPDPNRGARFATRTARTRNGAESIQGAADFQPFMFLSEGARVGNAVALVNAPGACGSGFLISETLFMTNNHVIRSIEDARRTTLTFNFQLDAGGQFARRVTFTLDPDRCFLTAAEDDLDFTIVALGSADPPPSMTFGFCPLSDREDKHALGIPLNIIQHPQLRPKEIVIRNNLLTTRVSRVLHYETDTEVGSSGSPVFNDLWEVVALHHYGQPFLETKDSEGHDLETQVNEGVRISAIIERLRALRGELSSAARDDIDHALALGAATPQDDEPEIVNGHPDGGSAEAAPAGQGAPMMDKGVGNEIGDAVGNDLGKQVGKELRIIIPVELTMRIGDSARDPIVVAQRVRPMNGSGGTPPAPPAAPAAASAEGPELSPDGALTLTTSRAEGVTIDTDYRNRDGYAPAFLRGTTLPLPLPKDRRVLAPLRDGGSELKYTHFSVLLHADRKMALITATNIDGPSYLKIVRATGRPRAEATDTWYPDHRVDDKYYLGGDYYAAAGQYFDRGHLTRREDPDWGPPPDAVRANADTFHLTNCTPQNWFFNESTTRWQGIERFVLEQGALPSDNRLCVFQGPVLNTRYARFHDALVPLEFWKIVAWIGKDTDRLKAAAFKVSQADLIKLKRGSPRPDGRGKDYLALYRVPVRTIENETQLDFGALKPADSRDAAGEAAERVDELTPDLL
jgi:endonuclease G